MQARRARARAGDHAGPPIASREGGALGDHLDGDVLADLLTQEVALLAARDGDVGIVGLAIEVRQQGRETQC